MKGVVDLKELESFFKYLADQTDEREINQAIERFLKEQVTSLNGSDIIK